MSAVIRSPKPTVGTIARATGMAIGVAVVLNIVLYFIASSAGWLPAETTMGTQIELVPVLLFTIVPAIVGAIVYIVLLRFLTHERANFFFVVLASIALIGMAVTPLTDLVTPTFGTVLILEIMHLVVGLPVMYFLTKTT